MKSLLDIQQEVRKLEQNVRDITEGIKTINSDIEEMKQSPEKVEIDYKKIASLARNIPFKHHPIRNLGDERACRMYLVMLLHIVALNKGKDGVKDGFIFIQWIKDRSDIDWSLEELVRESMRQDSSLYYDFAEMFPEQYKEKFLVDALIIGNLGGCASRKAMEYIANVSVIFDIDMEKLCNLSTVSKIILCQSVDGLDKAVLRENISYAKRYMYYLEDGLYELWKRESREIVVEQVALGVREFKWKVKAEQMVQVGDTIATYYEMKKKQAFRYVSNTSGVLYPFCQNYVYYGVIASAEDDMDSIKAWIKEIRE